ncbi:MAG: hypothetical protein J0M12_06430 [Deltaproteobacteria bacterium]|nr:hypothetical protein [Deltaproteobacteria bacterium]
MKAQLFSNPHPLIGVIHLPAMPGWDGSPGLEGVITKALAELHTLHQAGFDGALVENEGDRPHPLAVDRAYQDMFVELMTVLRGQARIPLGLEILYDMVSTVRVGIECGADFVRLDVFTDDTETRWGVVKACVEDVQSLRRCSRERPLLFTDVHVKHGRNLTTRSLVESGRLAVACGADGLIVTGTQTGVPPTIEDCRALKAAAGGIPVYVGSGFSEANAAEILSECSGVIMASSIKRGDSIALDLASRVRTVVDGLP